MALPVDAPVREEESSDEHEQSDRAADPGDEGHHRRLRGATLALGLLFLGFEIHDFLSMFRHAGGPDRSGFTSAFFALVPLHGLHVATGCIWILAMIAQMAVYGVDKDVKLGLLRLGLFWHFLDIGWVAIFSVVYLGGLA